MNTVLLEHEPRAGDAVPADEHEDDAEGDSHRSERFIVERMSSLVYVTLPAVTLDRPNADR